MRTIVDLPEDKIKALDAIAARDDVSRAELMRQAVSLYLAEEKKKKSKSSIDKYAGFLKDEPKAFDGLDGLAYQNKIRGEWDDREKMYGKWGMSDHPQAPYKAD